jgi:hypothetical protein
MKGSFFSAMVLGLSLVSVAQAKDLKFEDFVGKYDAVRSEQSFRCEGKLEIKLSTKCKGITQTITRENGTKVTETFCKGTETKTEKESAGHGMLPSVDRTKTKVTLEGNIITKEETVTSVSFFGPIKLGPYIDRLTLNADGSITDEYFTSSLSDSGENEDGTSLQSKCIYQKQ